MRNALTDKWAKGLLEQIFENLDNDALIFSNMAMLEKYYRKPEGLISDWIFYKDLSADEILVELKKNTSTLL